MPKPPKPPRFDESFEAVYPRYPFAELVRHAVLLGRWLARVRAIIGRPAKGTAALRRTKTIRGIDSAPS